MALEYFRDEQERSQQEREMPRADATHESKDPEERFANDSPQPGLKLRRYKKCQRDSHPRSRVTGSICSSVSAVVISLGGKPDCVSRDQTETTFTRVCRSRSLQSVGHNPVKSANTRCSMDLRVCGTMPNTVSYCNLFDVSIGHENRCTIIVIGSSHEVYSQLVDLRVCSLALTCSMMLCCTCAQ